MKKVLLLSHNFWPEPTGIGKYNGEMIAWLAKNNFQCTVITTFPYYPQWKVQAPYKNRGYQKETIQFSDDSQPVKVYRCPTFVPKNPTGKNRMLQDISFWLSKSPLIVKMLLNAVQHDLIITIAPPFHLAYLGLILKRKSSRLLYHIQDLQIEAAQDLGMLSSPRLFKRLFKVERDILERADFISTISEGMVQKVQKKIDKPVYFFPNWADTYFFFPIENGDRLKEKWGYQSGDVIFLYSGAIGEKQGLEDILFSAETFLDQQRIQFIICGSGPYKERLIASAQHRGLTNVKFLPVQEKENFNEFLNMADYHLVLQKANAGDLVMPSKLTTILAIGGVCIVTASSGTTLFEVVKKYDLGYVVEPEKPLLLTELISQVAHNTKGRRSKSENSRNYAVEYLNIDKVMSKFVRDFI